MGKGIIVSTGQGLYCQTLTSKWLSLFVKGHEEAHLLQKFSVQVVGFVKLMYSLQTSR